MYYKNVVLVYTVMTVTSHNRASKLRAIVARGSCFALDSVAMQPDGPAFPQYRHHGWPGLRGLLGPGH